MRDIRGSNPNEQVTIRERVRDARSRLFVPRSRTSRTHDASSSTWLVYLASGIIAILVYLLLPYPAVKALAFYPTLAVTATVAIVIGARMHHPAHLLVWYLFAAGQLAFIIGDIMFSFYEYVLEADPFPSLADAFYLGGYPPIVVALILLVRGRTLGGDRANFIDAMVIAIGLGMLSWVFLMAPYAKDPSLSLLERSVLITYPSVDVLLLAVLVRFMIAPGVRTPAYYLLGSSLIALLIADVSYGFAELAGTFQSGGLIDAGYLLSYVLWGTAALHPSMERLSEPVSDREVRPSRKRLVLLAGASLMAPAMLAIQAARGEPFDVPVIVVGSVVLFSLVLARMEGLLHTLTTTLAKHKQAERRLRKAEARYRTLVEQVPVVVYSGRLDKVSSAKYVSPQIEALLGFTPDEWLADRDLWVKLLHTEDRERVLAEVDLSGKTGRPFEAEYRLLTRDGRTVWVRDEAVMVRDEEIRLRHWLGVMEDITERKRAEEEMKEANRRLKELAVLKADFTAMVAHELGGPLAAMRRLAEMLSAGGSDPEIREYATTAMEAELDALGTLVSDVRASAEVERDDFRVRPRAVALSELLAEVEAFAHTLPEERPVELVLDPRLGEHERVVADPERIGQVLRNLLSNAAKYSSQGVLIELRAKKRGQERVRLEVADRGPGVRPKDQMRIFEKFGRGRDREGKKISGVGLGLYVSRGIARAHGSELTVYSAPGQGAVFCFDLKVAR